MKRRMIHHPCGTATAGFSLIEVLTSLAILSVLMVILATMLSSIQRSFNRVRDKAEKYHEARVAFDNLERRIAQATLNTYWGYDNPERPTEYSPRSELHFVCGPMGQLTGSTRRVHSGHGIFFQAPFGYGGDEAGQLGGGKIYNELDGAMNCWGYYVEFNSDTESSRPLRPGFLSSAKIEEKLRFRLMEFRLPSEKLTLFQIGLSGSTQQRQIYSWFADDAIRLKYSVPVADNIIALFFVPRAPGILGTPDDPGTSIAPAFLFDSRRFQWDKKNPSLSLQTRHQVPPVLDMVLIAVTETSWLNFSRNGAPEDLPGKLKIELKSPETVTRDLADTEKLLSSLNLDYRVFSTSVSLRTGKWITSHSR